MGCSDGWALLRKFPVPIRYMLLYTISAIIYDTFFYIRYLLLYTIYDIIYDICYYISSVMSSRTTLMHPWYVWQMLILITRLIQERCHLTLDNDYVDVNDVIMVEENGTRRTHVVEITFSVENVLSLIPYHGYAQDATNLEDIVDTRNTWECTERKKTMDFNRRRFICYTPVLVTQEMDTHVMYFLHFYITVYS